MVVSLVFVVFFQHLHRHPRGGSRPVNNARILGRIRAMIRHALPPSALTLREPAHQRGLRWIGAVVGEYLGSRGYALASSPTRSR
jgi:hypothetical protein